MTHMVDLFCMYWFVCMYAVSCTNKVLLVIEISLFTQNRFYYYAMNFFKTSVVETNSYK